VIDDQVTGVETEDGRIARLVLESGRRVEGEFFLDCSGFRRALIGELGADWVGYGDVLPVNRAMPFWIDLKPGEEIAPVILARAMKSGWMWRIPTRERYGCGYVYSDRHATPDEAKTEIEAALDHTIEPRNDIRIDAGRLREAWIGNCVAVGLASSFLEPLEATSIHGTVVQLMLLSQLIADPKGRRRYNTIHARQVDDFREFIRLHYVSERRDSPFWSDVAANHPPAIIDRVERWRHRLPRRQDFTPFPLNLPHVHEQLHISVLDGLGLLDRSRAKGALAADPKARARLRKLHADLVSECTRAAAKCLPHRAFVDSLIRERAA